MRGKMVGDVVGFHRFLDVQQIDLGRYSPPDLPVIVMAEEYV
jgi:hypothetical protein